MKNVGGTFDTPGAGAKIVGHFGMSMRAIAGVINHAVGSSIISCTLPTKVEQANCITLKDLRQLVIPALGDKAVNDNASTTSAASKGRKGKKTSGTVPQEYDNDTLTTSKKKKSKKTADPEHSEYTMHAAFKPAPHLQKMILEIGGPAQSSRTKKSFSQGNTPTRLARRSAKNPTANTGKFGKD